MFCFTRTSNETLILRLNNLQETKSASQGTHNKFKFETNPVLENIGSKTLTLQ